MSRSVNRVENVLTHCIKRVIVLCVFQGKVPYKVLQIHSTFQDYMVVTQVTFQPQDMRFYFQEQDSNIILKPQAATVVSRRKCLLLSELIRLTFTEEAFTSFD